MELMEARQDARANMALERHETIVTTPRPGPDAWYIP